MRRLLPLFLAAPLLAEPPRPADLGDTWVFSARARHDVGGGKDGLSIDSSGVRVEVLTRLTQLRDWQLSLSGAVGAEGHDLRPGTVVGLPRLESVRELDLGLVLSHRPPQAGGPARFYALEIGSRTADAAGPEEGIAISFAGGSSWKINETFTLGYLILAESREMESDLFLVVPTFRWAFAHEWSLATGRKSLVLARQFESSGEAFVTVGYDGEETRLEDLAGQEARLLDQRLYADIGYAWVAGSWNLRATLGWELDSEMRFQVGGVETEVDPGRGARAGLIGRVRF
ncbi:MAG TPA: hypothetical protein DCY41_07750 [Opitutae bacterium]|nr:hypothetical protein [Opitutae bacterium]